MAAQSGRIAPGRPRPKRNRKRTGLAAVDPRSSLARVVAAERASLAAHLGGAPSATEGRVVEAVLELDLLIGAGVAEVARRGPVDRRKGTYRPVVRDVAALIEKRHRLLADLGWSARGRELPRRAADVFALKPPSVAAPALGEAQRVLGDLGAVPAASCAPSGAQAATPSQEDFTPLDKGGDL